MQEFNSSLFKISFFLILFLIPSPSLSKEFSQSFIAWGTNLDFIVHSDLEEKRVFSVIQKVQRIPDSMELILNSKNPNSELSKFNTLDAQKKMKITFDLYFLIDKSIHYNKISDGYFDITIGSLNDSESQDSVLREVEECSGLDNLLLDKDKRTILKKKKCISLDLDGLAEGYVMMLMLEKFKENGFNEVLINFGGNVSTLSNKKKWKVSIKNPDFTSDINSTYDLNNLSISTSSQYSKFVKYENKTFSHIFDPIRKAFKGKENSSVSVISTNSLYADAMSTAIQAMPIEKAMNFLKEKEYLKVLILKKTKDGKIRTLFNNLP